MDDGTWNPRRMTTALFLQPLRGRCAPDHHGKHAPTPATSRKIRFLQYSYRVRE